MDEEIIIENGEQFAPATGLVKRVDELTRQRELLERQWKLNLSFFKGKQYVFYNRRSRRIESMPIDDGDKPRYRVRLVANQIAPHTTSLLSRLTKTKPTFFATPGQASYEAIKATEVAETLLDFWWDKFNLSEKREEAILWGIICGNGFWKISWDTSVGSSIKLMINPEGQPILSPLVEHFFRNELEKDGLDPSMFEQEVFEGEIRVDTLAPFDVLLDDTAQVFEDCKYAICMHPMGVEEIYSRYGARLKPNAINQYPDETLPGSYNMSAGKTKENVRIVYYGYFLPTADKPEGRYVVFVKSPDIVLYDSPWPYPFKMLPLVKFPGMRIPGQLYDSSVVEQAIPLQKELNRTLSQMIEYKNLTLKPQMLAPVGSLRQRMTDEPGAIFEYNPVAGKVPESIPIPSLPPYVFEHVRDIGQRIRDTFGLNEILQGDVPPNVEAGVAIDLLQEAATDRHAPQILMLEKALERAGNMMLQLAQKYYTEPRMLVINGSGSRPKIERFESADIIAGVGVRVETGSGLPRTRAGKQARVMQMLQMGLLTPTKAYKYLDMADFKSLQAQFQADEEQASREHDKLIDGMVVNEAAARQAQEQLMLSLMNTDPNTGMQAPVDPQLLQASIEAGLQPLAYENKNIHLEQHGLYMKSPEFEDLPSDVRDRFYKHYELTQVALSEETVPQGSAPRVSYQFRGAVGPTATSKILAQGGVAGVTPEELLEPSLDTVVIDNKDKPNAEGQPGGQVMDYQQKQLQELITQDSKDQQALNFEREKAAIRRV